MIDLTAEMWRGYIDLFEHSTATDRLVAQGVSRQAFLWPNGLDHMPIGLARVAFSGFTYEPDPMGDDAVLLPVRWNGELMDIVAWPLGQPRKWRTRLGLATLIGADVVRRAFHLDKAVLIHETPLQWLSAGRCGVVILEPAAARFELAIVRKLLVTDEVFGRRLDRMLRAPVPKYEIRVSDRSDNWKATG